MKLLNLINKNFRLLIRSKIGALIVLLGPLLIVLLVGMGFSSSSLQGIKIGVYSSGYNEFSDSLIQGLEDKQYVVIKADTNELCLSGVEAGKYHTCVVIPPNLEAGVTQENITFYVDYSRVNLVYLIISDMSSKISSKSTEISLSLTQNLLNVLEEAKTNVISKKEDIVNAKTNEESISSKLNTITSGSSGLDASFVSLNEKVAELTNLTANLSEENISANLSENFEDLADDIDGLVTSISSSLDTISAEASNIQRISSENVATFDALVIAIDALTEKVNVVQITQAEGIVSPLKTSIEPISIKTTNWHYLFPTLVSIVLMFVGIILAATLVVREKKSKAYFRNFVTPTTDFTFLVSIYLTCIIILFIQLAIIFTHAYFIIGQELLSVLANTCLVLFLGGSLFVFLGMAVGYIFASEEVSMLASVCGGALMLFFSNTILPIESTLIAFQKIAMYNPYVIVDNLLRQVIFFKEPLTNIYFGLISLAVISFVLLLLAFGAKQVSRRRV